MFAMPSATWPASPMKSLKLGHKVLPLNVGDPLNFDFQTPPHIIDAVYQAMREGKNGYAPSPGVPEALEAIRGEAARKGISTVRDVFVTSGRERDGRSLPVGAGEPWGRCTHAEPRLPAVLGRAVQTRYPAECLRSERRRCLATGTCRYRTQDHSAHARHRADQSEQSDGIAVHAARCWSR